jgi:hypothetical protein
VKAGTSVKGKVPTAKGATLATVADIPLVTRLAEVMEKVLEEVPPSRVGSAIFYKVFSRFNICFAGYSSGGYQQPKTSYGSGEFQTNSVRRWF